MAPGLPPIRCVVLDFDGTFTDVHEEAREFPAAYQRDVSDICGRDVSKEWAAAAESIASDPDKYGWEVAGKLVAPANADPYVHSTAVATLLWKRMGVLRDARLRNDIVQIIYKHAYEQTRTAFRPHAREVIGALLASGIPTYIVTNSHTEMVEKKLADLGLSKEQRPHVVGEARKFIAGALPKPDPVFDALPETTQVAGLVRPVYVRRAYYFQALSKIWKETGTAPENTLVCGDIYELDLALPAHLGAQIHLMTREGTNRWERTAVEALGARGGCGDDLRDILKRLR